MFRAMYPTHGCYNQTGSVETETMLKLEKRDFGPGTAGLPSVIKANQSVDKNTPAFVQFVDRNRIAARY